MSPANPCFRFLLHFGSPCWDHIPSSRSLPPLWAWDHGFQPLQLHRCKKKGWSSAGRSGAALPNSPPSCSENSEVEVPLGGGRERASKTVKANPKSVYGEASRLRPLAKKTSKHPKTSTFNTWPTAFQYQDVEAAWRGTGLSHLPLPLNTARSRGGENKNRNNTKGLGVGI